MSKIIICGPSGVGKTTVISEILEKNLNFELSISYTTRKMRNLERDGVEYRFISLEKFDEMRKNGEFVETEFIFNNYYGTKKHDESANIIFNVDLAGMKNLKKIYPESMSFLIIPPSLEALKHRLNQREETCSDRALSFSILQDYFLFDYVVCNQDICQTAQNILNIINLQENQRANKMLCKNLMS